MVMTILPIWRRWFEWRRSKTNEMQDELNELTREINEITRRNATAEGYRLLDSFQINTPLTTLEPRIEPAPHDHCIAHQQSGNLPVCQKCHSPVQALAIEPEKKIRVVRMRRNDGKP